MLPNLWIESQGMLKLLGCVWGVISLERLRMYREHQQGKEPYVFIRCSRSFHVLKLQDASNHAPAPRPLFLFFSLSLALAHLTADEGDQLCLVNVVLLFKSSSCISHAGLCLSPVWTTDFRTDFLPISPSS